MAYARDDHFCLRGWTRSTGGAVILRLRQKVETLDETFGHAPYGGADLMELTFLIALR